MIEIALMSGYESQQAFAGSFKAMYKMTPGEYRAAGAFYPLQLELRLTGGPIKTDFSKDDIRFAASADIDGWMELVRLSVDGYPCLREEEYLKNLYRHISERQAFILERADMAAGIMAFSADTGRIEFWAIHPQYRGLGMEQIFLHRLAEELPRGQEISLTTYREGDKADTGYRKEYLRLGFSEKELLTEYGYPTQRLVLLPNYKEQGETANA